MSYSSRALTYFNLIVILSLLASLVPPSRPSVTAGERAIAAVPIAAPDSPLPPPVLAPEPQEALQLALTVEPETANPGEVVTYTLSLTNTGTTRLRDVALNAVFVPGLVYLSGDEGAYDPSSYTWRYTLPRLKAGETASLHFYAQLADDAAGALPCSAYVGAGDPAQALHDTAIVQAGGIAAFDSGTGEGLEAGWQLLYNPPVVSTFSGAASYNHPIEVPPGRNGLQPSVNLGYSSRAVDGATWWVDSSFAGLGWSVDSIDITRRNVAYCWDDNLEWICLSDGFSLVLNGTSYVLTPDTGVTLAGRYYAENAPGLRVELHEDSTANYTGQYWTVHTPDGTQYRLGHNLDSEQKVFRVYHATLPQHQVYRWRVDQVSDVFGNLMAFTYREYTTLERDYASYPANIWYNNYGSGQWASRVQFVGSTIGAEPGQAPIFRTRRKLNAIRVYHLGQVVREYVLTYQTEDHNHRTLREIDHYGLGGAAGGQSLPTTVLDYADFYNKKWELGEHQDHCNLDGTTKEGHEEWFTMCQYWGEQFPYPRLVQVENGYGGVTGLTYSDPLYNGSKPEKYYTVVESQTWDGVEHVHHLNDTAASRTTYEYDNACWNSAGHGCNAPGNDSHKLIGFYRTTVRQWEHDGANWQALSTSVHEFDTTSYWRMGRETQSEVSEGGGGPGTLLRRVENTYVDDSTGLPSGIHFVYLEESTSTVWQSGVPKSRRTVFEYNLVKQGGSNQYGNLTHVHEYDENDALYRSQVQKFAPNEGPWIVNKPMWSGVYDGAGQLLSLTYYVYDDQDDWRDGPGDQGRLTLTRARVQPDPTPYFEQVELTVDARFGYDDYGNPTSQTVYEDYGKIEYDGSKWIAIRVGGGAAYVTTTDYDTTYDLYPRTVTNPLGQVSHVEYYAVDGVTSSGGLPGQVYRAWDANGTATATAYACDAFGRLTKVARPGDNLNLPTTWYVYADGPAPYKVESWQRETSGCAACAQPVFSFYDGLGRVVQSRAETKDAFKQAVVNTSYDALGRVCETYVPTEEDYGGFDRPSGWDSRPKTSVSYDALGRATQMTQTDRTIVRTTYDGWRTAALDENGHQRIQEVDALGRLVTVHEYVRTYSGVNWSATPYATTQYGYDELDALGSVTDEAGNVTTMAYDALGRKTEMDDPDMGNWRYQYAPSGNLTVQIDAERQAINFYYDELDRPKGKTRDSGPVNPDNYSRPTDLGVYDVTYIYDQGNYGKGYRTYMEDGSGHTTWSYDERGRATEEIKVITGAGTFKTQWDYDAADRLLWIKYPGGDGGQEGEQVDYAYTDQGLLDSVVGSETYVQGTTYDASGRVELRTLGSGTLGSGTLHVDYVYYPWTTLNGRGRLEWIKTGTSADPTSLQELHYTYDAVGNVLSIADHQAAGGTQTQSFAYDALDRLESASASGGSGGTYAQENYTYNKIGNLTNKGGVTQSYPASGASSVRPHAVTSTSDGRSYLYDANGNQVKRDLNGKIYDLSYDAENRLVRVSESASQQVTEFDYDGDGVRVKQSNRFGTTVYVGNIYERFVPQSAYIGEVGLINDTLTHSPQEIAFSRPYANPVVFAQPLSYDGSDTSVVRITDVQSDRFTLYVDEAPDKDGFHTTESVSWVVLEAGQWELYNGTLLEVGLVDTGATVGSRVSNVWEAVDFNLPFSTAPVVVSQVQTQHDAAWVKTRQRDASSSGFEVALEPADSQTTAHDGERIGWLAIEAGTGNWNGRKYEAAKTANAVTHNWYSINFGQSFSAAPRFIAALSTLRAEPQDKAYDGSDGSHLRYSRTSLMASGVQVMVEEDTTYDTETGHTTF